MTLDVASLRVVQALARHGTVTSAAHSLGLTQSTVSHALGKLRRHYGDPLFVPIGKQLSHTPLAARLIAESERLLIDFERIEAITAGFDPRLERQRFRVHMIDVAELHVLPGLLRHIAQEGLRVEVEVVRAAGHEAWSELESGRLDLVIGTPWKAQPSLYRQRLFDEQYVGIARAQHPLTEQLNTLDGYLRCVHCCVTPRGPAIGRIEAALAALSPLRKVRLRLPDYLSVPSLVAGSDLVAAVPATLVANHPARDLLKVFTLPITDAEFTVVQYWHPRVHEDPANMWLRRTVGDVMPLGAAPRRAEGVLPPAQHGATAD
jgi:DNA-binding transcriptional LysR family regulator